jgi:hypothetical protein
MRRAKADDNQPEIVAALRGIGATVEHLHRVGGGCPDLLVGWRGGNHLIEVKDGAKAASDRKLTPAQVDWHDGWKGSAFVVTSVDEALAAIGAKDKGDRWQQIGNVARSMVTGKVE